MPKGVPRNWPPDEEIVAACLQAGSVHRGADVFGIPPTSFRRHVDRRGLTGQIQVALAGERPERKALSPDPSDFDMEVHAAVSGKQGATVEEIADRLDVPPKRVREALERLRERGYRVPEATDAGAAIVLEPLDPEPVNLHKSLLAGKQHRIGVVSDTHLCSSEEALAELNLAYDHFADAGVSEVYHAGDLVAGRGIYQHQDRELKVHTFDGQVEYAVERFPERDGIHTRIIGGNHDLEGHFGRQGANPVAGVCNQREDLDYLGDYSAWVDFNGGGERPAWLHVAHGGGGMSYAYSYKAQKFIEGYPLGRKPFATLLGHFHVRGDFEARGVQLLFPGCFERQTSLGRRRNLQPAVGFHIVEFQIAGDGSCVDWFCRWKPIYEGRTTLRAAA